MAIQERTKTGSANLRKLGILALGASLTLAACGTSVVLSGTGQTTTEHQTMLRDPENPHWSGNTAAVETSEQASTLMGSEPYWSHDTATPAANDAVDQPHPRPY